MLTKINSWLNQERTKQKILLSSTYIVLLFLLLSILFMSLPSEWYISKRLISFDAVHYQQIANSGYEGLNIAFFPLFPMFWEYLGFTAVGISIFNGVLFLVSHLFLSTTYKWNNFQHILTLVLPSGIFFFVPYSEALFFVAATMILVGFHKQLFWLICIALLATSLSRPSFSVFIPALIILYVVNRNNSKFGVASYVGMILSVLLGAFIVAYIQYLDTGIWFKYFAIQKEWGNELQWIKFPLFSWGRPYIIKYDGITFLIGIVVGIISLRYMFFNKSRNHFNDSVFFSLLYISGITALILLFRGGELFSINRFIWSTPFGMLIIAHFVSNSHIKSFKMKYFWACFVTLVLYWLLFGSYVHIQTFLKFGALSLALASLLFLFAENYPKIKLISRIVFVLFLFGVQTFFFYVYLTGGWIA